MSTRTICDWRGCGKSQGETDIFLNRKVVTTHFDLCEDHIEEIKQRLPELFDSVEK